MAFNAAVLRLLSDEARGFSLDVRTEHIAEQLLALLYLPGVDTGRMAAGRRVVRRWVGSRVTTPVPGVWSPRSRYLRPAVLLGDGLGAVLAPARHETPG